MTYIHNNKLGRACTPDYKICGGNWHGHRHFTSAARDIAWCSQSICTAVIILGYVQFTFRTVHTMAQWAFLHLCVCSRFTKMLLYAWTCIHSCMHLSFCTLCNNIIREDKYLGVCDNHQLLTASFSNVLGLLHISSVFASCSPSGPCDSQVSYINILYNHVVFILSHTVNTL